MAGRPSTYSDDMVIKAKEYLDSCSDTYDKETKQWTVNLPKSEGLARHLNVARSTIYKWAEEHEAFSDILEQINIEQANRLLNSGLAGTYNANIAKLALGKQGYHDRTETDVTTKGESINDKPTTEQLALIRELENKIKNG